MDTEGKNRFRQIKDLWINYTHIQDMMIYTNNKGLYYVQLYVKPYLRLCILIYSLIIEK